MYEEEYLHHLMQMNAKFDDARGLIALELCPWEAGKSGGYHTRISGIVHDPQQSVMYAELVYYLQAAELYPRAERALCEVAALQDADESSRTYGLWSYYAEEPLTQMIAPDYNKTDFICRHYAYIMKKRAKLLSEETRQIVTQAMKRGAACSIRRNVGVDYTNISLMSLNTIVGAAEVSGDEEMLCYARSRMAHVLAFDRFCGAFCEYNSPTYTILAVEETTRMRQLFEDAECLRMAEELDDMGWRMIATHYSAQSRQMAPPHKRAYHDFDTGLIPMLIYVGTNGKYGVFDQEHISLARLPYHCPEKYWHYFEPVTETRSVFEAYYRKNDMRRPEQDATIVRDLQSPDLHAMSTITPDYSIGAFDISDTWVQRHNCMVTIGKGNKLTCFRMRGMKADETQGKDYEYDTCMGFVNAAMEGSSILGQIALTTDHGDFHYILDKVKDGIYTCDRLFFAFSFTGYTDDLVVKKREHGFLFTVNGVQIHLSVYNAMAEGRPISLTWNEAKKRAELVLFDTHRILDLNALGTVTATFTMSVNREMEAPTIREAQGIRYATCEKTLSVATPLAPVPYNTAVGIAAET